MTKSRMKQDCEAGYTLRQAIRRSVARDPITQRDIRTMQEKGWRIRKSMAKTIASLGEEPDSFPWEAKP